MTEPVQNTHFEHNIKESASSGARGTISDFIRGDLLRRLVADEDDLPSLTLTALAHHYSVSFTPIREAIRSLVAEGILIRQGRGRVQIDPQKARAVANQGTEVSVTLSSRPGWVEEALAAEVISRSLKGESQYLREEATATRLGVGRTAIRQAFGRLAGRGLVIHVPRCGWQVRPFDERDMDAYLELREALEHKALDLARPRLVASDLQRMLDGNDPAGEESRLNNDLHGYLIEKAGNPYLRDFFDRHGAYYTSIFDFAAPETHHIDQMARQHRAILEALLQQDWPRAKRELSAHIRAQRPIIRELMAQIPGRVPAE